MQQHRMPSIMIHHLGLWLNALTAARFSKQTDRISPKAALLPMSLMASLSL